LLGRWPLLDMLLLLLLLAAGQGGGGGCAVDAQTACTLLLCLQLGQVNIMALTVTLCVLVCAGGAGGAEGAAQPRAAGRVQVQVC
jgi:hypothetical protein